MGTPQAPESQATPDCQIAPQPPHRDEDGRVQLLPTAVKTSGSCGENSEQVKTSGSCGENSEQVKTSGSCGENSEQVKTSGSCGENSEQVKTSGSSSLDAHGRLHQAVPDFTAAPAAPGAGTSPSPEPRWLRLKSFLAKTRRIHFNFKIPTRRHRKVDPGLTPSNMDLGQNVDTSAIHAAPASSPQKPHKRSLFMLASCFRGSE
ncbi:uncharacterized protein LOC134458697 [Engraulis encrasicolus]|uniref:uncharacterized protein LOC134458697 n=1 Tax=Engraulis encrasicolus TaxID=184585 RepID=UPI002FCEA029